MSLNRPYASPAAPITVIDRPMRRPVYLPFSSQYLVFNDDGRAELLKRPVYLPFSSQYLVFNDDGRAELLDLEELATWRAALELILACDGGTGPRVDSSGRASSCL